jgi:5-methylcytosine-specific restriction endonuclease McrA
MGGQKNHGYKILQTYSLEEGTRLATSSKSKRLKNLIKLGNECVSCGLTASKFMFGIDKGGGSHLDMYSSDNTLFTIDHIQPLSKGGRDHIDNMQLMCSPCNEKKGNSVDIKKGNVISNFKSFKTNESNDQTDVFLASLNHSLRNGLISSSIAKFILDSRNEIEDALVEITDSGIKCNIALMKNAHGSDLDILNLSDSNLEVSEDEISFAVKFDNSYSYGYNGDIYAGQDGIFINDNRLGFVGELAIPSDDLDFLKRSNFYKMLASCYKKLNKKYDLYESCFKGKTMIYLKLKLT